MTIPVLKKWHKEFWNWLGRNPKLKKFDWPQWIWNGGSIKQIRSSCFICAAVPKNDCNSCPVNWNPSSKLKTHCMDSDSLFKRWEEPASLKERSEIAYKIANMEWNI